MKKASRSLLTLLITLSMLLTLSVGMFKVSAATNLDINWWPKWASTWTEGSNGVLSGISAPLYGNQFSITCGNPVQPQGDFTFQADFTTMPNSGEDTVNFSFKNPDGADIFAGIFIKISKWGSVIVDKLDGSFTDLPESGRPELINYSAGAFNRIRVVFLNGKFSYYINGTKQVSDYTPKVANANGWIVLGAQSAVATPSFKNIIITQGSSVYKSFMCPDDYVGDWAKTQATSNTINVSSSSTGLNFVTTTAPNNTADYRAIQKSFGGSSNFTVEYEHKADSFNAGAALGIAFSPDTTFLGNLSANGVVVRQNLTSATSGQVRYFEGNLRKDNSAGFTQLPTYNYSAGFVYKKVKVVITNTALDVWAEDANGVMQKATQYTFGSAFISSERNVLTIFSTACSSTFRNFKVTHDGVVVNNFEVDQLASTNSLLGSNLLWQTNDAINCNELNDGRIKLASPSGEGTKVVQSVTGNDCTIDTYIKVTSGIATRAGLFVRSTPSSFNPYINISIMAHPWGFDFYKNTGSGAELITQKLGTNAFSGEYVHIVATFDNTSATVSINGENITFSVPAPNYVLTSSAGYVSGVYADDGATAYFMNLSKTSTNANAPFLTSYSISNNYILTGFAKQTSLDAFLTAMTLRNGTTVTAWNAETEFIAGDFVGTGDTIKITINGVPTDCTALLKGDNTGDGDITFLDLVVVKSHLLKLNPITDEVLIKASDVDNSLNISISDLILIKKCILGLATIS